VSENPSDHHRIFDTGDNSDFTSALIADLNIKVKYTLQPLGPGHGCPALGSCLVLVGWPDLFDFAPFCWGYLRTVFTIGGEDTMETGEVKSGLGDQCEQPGDGRSCASMRPRHTVHPVHKIQRLENNLRCSIAHAKTPGFIKVHQPQATEEVTIYRAPPELFPPLAERTK